MTKLLDPLIVCIADTKIIMDSLTKSLAKEGWPIVFQSTPDLALSTNQENLVSVIIDPLFNTACPACGRLSNWGEQEAKCECGFKPKKGRNVYLSWPDAKKLTVVVLSSNAPKNTVVKLREKGYWALRLKKDDTILDLPRIIKRALKTMSKYYLL
jgi:hypothetical protein